MARGILSSSGTVGLFHDWSIGPFPEMIAKYSYDGLQLYDANLGNKVYPSDWLFRILLVPFAFLGGEIVSKGMLIFFITLSGFFMFYFGKTLKLSYFSSLIGGLIYVFSPIVFTKAVAGYVYYLLGYALTPFLLVVFFKAQRNKEKRLTYSIISGLIFGLIGTQIQFFIMGFTILLTLVLIDYRNLKNGLIVLTSTTVIGSVLHFPWILPLILTPSTTSPSTQTFLAYHEITSCSTILESIRVVGYKIQPYSYTQLISQGIVPSWIFYTNFLMPIIASLALLLKRNRYTIGFGAMVGLGVFLLKGINPPLEDLFIVAFQYTPLVIFRELWHVAFLAFFSYTILTSICLHEITKRTKLKTGHIRNYALAVGLAVIIVVSNGYPLFLGNFAGYIQTYSLSEDYRNLFQSFQKDQNQYRVLWLPAIMPMKYDNKSLFGVDPLISFSPKPTFPQHIIPQYPLSTLTMFLVSTIQENKTQQFGNIISPFATKYIILRNDFSSKYPFYVPLGLYPGLREKWEPNVTSNFIRNQQDLQLKDETPSFRLYQNTNPSDFIYMPTTIIYGTKDLSTLVNLAKISNLSDIIYLTDITQLETRNPLFLVKDDGFDLIPIITGVKIDPGNYATELDAEKGWINSKYWFWYNYLFASTINNGAFSKTESQLTIPIKTKGRSEIWAKVLKWPKGGRLRFQLDDERDVTMITSSSAFCLQWIKLFEENSNYTHILTVSNLKGENYIDELLVLNKEEIEESESSLEDVKIIYLIEPQSFERNLLRNPSFEEATEDAALINWTPAEEGFQATLDNQTKYQGEVSLRVTTSLNSSWRWSWIRSSPIKPVAGKYQVVTHMKQENAEQSHIVIEGFNQTENAWIQLSQVPAGQDGSSDWKSYETNLELTPDITMLRMALNAGWVLDDTDGDATTWFDDLLIVPQLHECSNDVIIAQNTSITRDFEFLKEGEYRISVEVSGKAAITIANQTNYANSTQQSIVDVGSVIIEKGLQKIKIEALEDTYLGSLWIYSNVENRSLRETIAPRQEVITTLEYAQEKPTSWVATINASEPFLLAFAAPYDQQWRACTDLKEYKPFASFSFINIFWINETGLLQIRIEYKPQKLFYIGTIITLVICTMCFSVLFYDKVRFRIRKHAETLALHQIKQLQVQQSIMYKSRWV
ncbi:MAG: hypothetical protein OEW62_01340 [Candidatus Bathyarchaeota archaeon]|nr:hypothetical protein [Candidatus Bathyarchaeota archaeon]